MGKTERKILKAQAPESPFARKLVRGLHEAIDFVRGSGAGRMTKLEIPSQAPIYKAKDVAALRKHLGLTQKRLAGLMNVSEQSVEGWESGRKSPGPASRRLLQLTHDFQTLEILAGLAGYRLMKSKRSSKSVRAWKPASPTREIR